LPISDRKIQSFSSFTSYLTLLSKEYGTADNYYFLWVLYQTRYIARYRTCFFTYSVCIKLLPFVENKDVWNYSTISNLCGI